MHDITIGTLTLSIMRHSYKSLRWRWQTRSTQWLSAY